MGTVLWRMNRSHPVYGEEGAELCVNEADELLLVVDNGDEAASTLTRQEAAALRDALTAWLER
jgi:hypothetical protein